MTGVEFVDHLAVYEKALGLPALKIGVVAKNPDKSKHLETATVQLEGHSIDFVNLRNEK